eukprot:4655538-Pyramimonas_sp.AAC.1
MMSHHFCSRENGQSCSLTDPILGPVAIRSVALNMFTHEVDQASCFSEFSVAQESTGALLHATR